MYACMYVLVRVYKQGMKEECKTDEKNWTNIHRRLSNKFKHFFLHVPHCTEAVATNLSSQANLQLLRCLRGLE